MDTPALLVTAALLAGLAVACLLPVYADSADDRGDGRTNVVIPGYVRTPNHRPRTWAFLAISAVAGLLFLGWKRPSLPLLYSEGVRDVAVALTHDPASVNGYIARLRPALAFFAVAYIVAISLVVRARLGRRAVMLLHAPLYLAMTVLTQALMISVGIATGWLVAPFGIEATLANLLIGGLVIMRLTFTAFALPRSTTVPRIPRNRFWGNLLTWCALITVITVLVGLYAFISQQANLGSVWQVFVPLYAVSMLFLLMFAPLWLLWWANWTLPRPGRRPSRRGHHHPGLQRAGQHRPPAEVHRYRGSAAMAARSGWWSPTTAPSMTPKRWPPPRSPASATPTARSSTARTAARPPR